MNSSEASSEFAKLEEKWQTHWDWESFRSVYRAERQKIARFVREQGLVLDEQFAGMFFHYEPGSDEDDVDCTPA